MKSLLKCLFVGSVLASVNNVVFADWPVEVLTSVCANPVIADINGDGKNEAVIATLEKRDESKIYLLDGKGEPLSGWPKSVFDDNQNSMVNNEGPAVADFDGDGKLEICFSTGWTGPGKIHLLDYKGNYLQGWPVAMPEKGVPQSPVIADIDNDGKLEIVAGTSNPDAFYAYEFDGSLVEGWPRKVSGNGRGVIVGNIADNGKNDIVAWTASGKLYGWKSDGTNLWPPMDLKDMRVTSCVLADLDNDKNMKIVVGTEKGGVYILDAKTLNPLKGWESPKELGQGDIRISLADLDRDKKLELVVNFIGRDYKKRKYSGAGAVHIFKSDGSVFPGWPQQLNSSWVDYGVVLGDIDGDNKIEIIGNTRDGKLHAWRSNGNYVEDYPKALFGNRPLIAGPVLGDLDGDGYVDATIVYYNAANKVFLVKFLGVYDHLTLPWPRTTYNNQNNRIVK